MRNGSSTTIDDIQVSGWTVIKLHNTSRSQHITKRRLWWLFGGLYPVPSITAFWIRAKRLQRRSTANKSTKCTRSSDVCARDWSIWPILLHDNARPHVAQSTLQKLNELGYETLPHPAYSPDLSSTDYHFFKHLDNFLRDKCFKNQDDDKNAFNAFVTSREADFYSSGINKLIYRWQECVDCNGSYFD